MTKSSRQYCRRLFNCRYEQLEVEMDEMKCLNADQNTENKGYSDGDARMKCEKITIPALITENST